MLQAVYSYCVQTLNKRRYKMGYVNFKKLSIEQELDRYLDSAPNSAEYSAYYQWSDCPCGINRKGGNAVILSLFSNDLKPGESLWLMDSWTEGAVARVAYTKAKELAPGCTDRWRLELPVLRAIHQIKRLPIIGSLSAKTVAETWGLSVPRAEFVCHIIWGE
jgi:hypothetical protein